jgi:WD40 repeat protein
MTRSARWAATAFLFWACPGRLDDDADSPPIPLVEIERAEPIAFDKDVYPILAEKCTVCHDKEGGLAEGELDLTTVAAMHTGGKRGPAIAPEKGEESLLFQLAGRRRKPHMPPEENDPLTSEELSLLKAWIDRGAAPGENLRPADDGGKLTLEALPPGVNPVYAVAMNSAGDLLATGRGGDVVLFDAAGALVARLSGHRDIVSSLRFSPDDQWLAAGGYEIALLWRRNAVNEGGQTTWDGPVPVGPVRERAAALAFSPDSKRLAVGGGVPSASGQILLYDLETRIVSRTWPEAHTDVVYGLAFRPDGEAVASGSADRFVKVHAAATGELTQSFEGHTGHVLGVAWNQDGTLLASAGADRSIKLWSLESGERVRSIGQHGGEITALEWLRPTQHLLTSCADRHARLLNPNDGAVVRAFGGAKDYLLSVAASADGKRVAAGCQNGDVYVWNAEDGSLLQTISVASDASPDAASGASGPPSTSAAPVGGG